MLSIAGFSSSTWDIRIMWKPRYVRSQLPCSCVIATLAMLTEQPFSKVLKGLKNFWVSEGQFNGIGDAVFESYLAQRGYAIRKVNHEYEPMCILRKEWPPKPPFAERNAADVFDQGMHAIVVLEDGRVLDPNDRKKRSLADYERVYSISSVYKVGEPLLDIKI